MVTLQKDLSEIKGVQMKSYELIEKMQMNLKNKDQIFENILNKLEENNLEVPPQDAAIPSDWQIELMDGKSCILKGEQSICLPRITF